MRLLCGLLLFSIIDCCFIYSCRNLKPCVSFYCRGHSIFYFNSSLTVAFSHSWKLFLALFRLIPTKLAHFQLICQHFFSFKNLVHKQISSHLTHPKILEFTPWYLDFFKGEMDHQSLDRFQSPCDNIELPVQLFKQKKSNLRKTAEITIQIALC